MDTTWSIETKSNGTITADAIAIDSDWPTVTRAGSVTMRFWFDEASGGGVLVVEDGETYTVGSGESETVRHATVADGGTLTVDGTLTIEEGGLYQLLQYLDYADAAAYGKTQNHRPWYRNQLPPDTAYNDIQSLVLGFEPSSDLRNRAVTGLWGLVTGGADVRNATLTNWQLELECFVLGEWDEYADHAAVQADLEG